jgi:hypothetical protein
MRGRFAASAHYNFLPQRTVTEPPSGLFLPGADDVLAYYPCFKAVLPDNDNVRQRS